MIVCLATVEDLEPSKRDILEQNQLDHQRYACIAIHFYRRYLNDSQIQCMLVRLKEIEINRRNEMAIRVFL